ncbi:unnamed protein product [Moneuplotes crassus]|uniref:Uncharacterized protein n=1 Tax=Euplotes crassus TaxID=5936 RepID=A0AAD1Y3I3_EUPCR|nr:unnamed protein product [Moneuplotes crassus]
MKSKISKTAKKRQKSISFEEFMMKSGHKDSAPMYTTFKKKPVRETSKPKKFEMMMSEGMQMIDKALGQFEEWDKNSLSQPFGKLPDKKAQTTRKSIFFTQIPQHTQRFPSPFKLEDYSMTQKR